MNINGKVYCLFEQSGTFKNAFKMLGYDAMDIDIQNAYGETDIVTDIFNKIDKCMQGESSIFDNMFPDDLLMAFFPCIYFSEANQLFFTRQHVNIREKSSAEYFKFIIERAEERHRYYIKLLQLCSLVEERNLRLVIENPWSPQSFLYNNFPYKPYVDYNRAMRGDRFVKSTQYFFINCQPEYLYTCDVNYNTKTVKGVSGNKVGGICNKERSKITPRYADNFIKDQILGIPRKGTQLTVKF